jgi:hypothetical protein
LCIVVSHLDDLLHAGIITLLLLLQDWQAWRAPLMQLNARQVARSAAAAAVAAAIVVQGCCGCQQRWRVSGSS